MAKHTHNLPEVLIPEGDICVPLFIPADTGYVSLVVRQLRQLTLDRLYDRDENHSALVVREQFNNRLYQPFIDALFNGDECSDCDDDSLVSCFRVNTTSEAFSFYPNDPFTSEEAQTIVMGLTWRRWEDADVENSDVFQYIENVISELLGYYPNDALLFPTNLFNFAFSNIIDLIEFVTFQVPPFPYIRFEFEGEGEVDFELVNFPFGCAALLIPDLSLSLQDLIDLIIEYVDGDGEIPAAWILTELDRDILSIPPETAATQGQEITFSEAGEHTVHVVFIPRLTLDPPFVNPFGGIREVEVCGNLKLVGSQSGEIIDKRNAGLSQHVRQGVIPLGTQQEFYDALIRYETEKANRWLLSDDKNNVKAGVSIDPITGKISLSQQIKEPLPGSTSNEILMGQARAVGKRFADMVGDELLEWYDGGAGVSIATAATRLRMFYSFIPFDELDPDPLYEALNLTLAAATDTVTPVVNPDAIALIIFCNGASKQSLYRYALDVETGGGSDAEDIADFYRALIDNLTEEQVQAWYDSGIDTPSGGYESAPCYRLPVQEFTYSAAQMVANASLIPYIQIDQTDRVKKYEISGAITGDEGRKFDGFYYVSDTGAITKAEPRYGRDGFGGSELIVAPTYKPDGDYGVLFDMDGTDTYINNLLVSTNVTARASFVNPVGSLTIKLYDVGAQ